MNLRSGSRARFGLSIVLADISCCVGSAGEREIWDGGFNIKVRGICLLLLGVFGFSSLCQTDRANAQNTSSVTVRRVLLNSIDGFHAMDLAMFVHSHPNSALALLSSSGVTYTEASTSGPSNSFPGLLSLVTGGSPASTGVWYEGAYARTLSAPGSDCKTVGTEVIWNNSLDKNKKVVDAGGV